LSSTNETGDKTANINAKKYFITLTAEWHIKNSKK